jgi:uncharacterized protein
MISVHVYYCLAQNIRVHKFHEYHLGRTEADCHFQKHGLDFADVVDFEWETAVIDATHSSRMKAIGYFADGTVVVIFAALGIEAISIISFRPASAKERKVLNGH